MSHELSRSFPGGTTLRATSGTDNGRPVVKVQWLKPNGQPLHQPLQVDVSNGAEQLEAIAAFIKELRILFAQQPPSNTTL